MIRPGCGQPRLTALFAHPVARRLGLCPVARCQLYLEFAYARAKRWFSGSLRYIGDVQPAARAGRELPSPERPSLTDLPTVEAP
jgi:hypothetical protein